MCNTKSQQSKAQVAEYTQDISGRIKDKKKDRGPGKVRACEEQG